MALHEPLIDSFGRIHTNLRISVTDRCNIRCFYCMPLENVQFKPRNELLTFEEIERFTRISASLGINKIRLTGGEPLVRSGMPALIRQLIKVPGIEEIAMTTNGLLLEEHASDLFDAGLTRLNISLDALSEEMFEKIARRKGLDRVLAGIAAAKSVGFKHIKINTVAMTGISETEIIPLAKFAREQDLHLRFIEFMPLDAEHNWENEQVISGQKLREIIEQSIGELSPVKQADPNQPSVDYQYADGKGKIGFIDSVTQPFCVSCNRLRITAEGQIRNCLFSEIEWDAREAMRTGKSDQEIIQLMRDCVLAKKKGHGTDTPGFAHPDRAMYQIGG
ncbi:MAG: GTP 3',8-cyclase MoaA [Blastopirellula sp.]|nr:MAG: GTP 3',8-cyclase MoaA [Blastopirellula sp.]